MIIALPPSLYFSPVKENWVKYGQQGLLHLPRLHRQLKDVRPGVHASVYNCKVSTKCFFLSFSLIFICLTLTAYCAKSETRFRLSRLSVVLYILHKEGTNIVLVCIACKAYVFISLFILDLKMIARKICLIHFILENYFLFP